MDHEGPLCQANYFFTLSLYAEPRGLGVGNDVFRSASRKVIIEAKSKSKERGGKEAFNLDKK